MPIKILLLFLTVAFTEHVVEANRVYRTQGDTDDMGPVFPHEAFGIGYEDFLNRIHPPLMAAMNYRPVMPHDIPQLASDGQTTSVALSSNTDAVVETNEEATKSESFTSVTLEVLPTPVAEQMVPSLSSPTPELETSTGESSAKTVEAATTESEEREESTEEIYDEPENVSESNSEVEPPEYQIEKPSTLSEYSIFNSEKGSETMDVDDENEKLPNSMDKSKGSAEEFADAAGDKASATVYEAEASKPDESESSTLKISHETQEIPHISSEDFVASRFDEKSSSSSDDDYYYYAPDYKYTDSEVFDEASDDEFTTSSYEYSDSTSEYYSTDLVESEEKVFVFPETHETQDSSYAKESESMKKLQSDSSSERKSSSLESNLKSESITDATEKIKSSDSKDDMRDGAEGSSTASKMSQISEEWESVTYSRRVDNDNSDKQKSSNDENSEHNLDKNSKGDSDSKQRFNVGSEVVSSEASKPTQVSSEPVSSHSESLAPSSSLLKEERGESYSGKTTFSASGEAAASISFPMSSKSSVQSEELVNIPHIMEEIMALREATKVNGQKLDFESMRKIIEQAITELSSLRKRLTRKEYVLNDLNQVIDELQKLCQTICANLPEKYLMPGSDSKSISTKSKRH